MVRVVPDLHQPKKRETQGSLIPFSEQLIVPSPVIVSLAVGKMKNKTRQ
jgi:hypothetical protein